MRNDSEARKPVDRREALRRIGLALAVAYVAPNVTTISAARAGSGGGSGGGGGGSGGGGGGGSGGGGSGGGNSGPGGGSGGSGGGNSGPGGGSRGGSGGRKAGGGSRGSGSDSASARAAVRRGEARPLSEVIASVKKQYAGRVVGVRFHSSKTTSTYYLKMVNPSGRLVEVRVNAKSKQILQIKGY